MFGAFVTSTRLQPEDISLLDPFIFFGLMVPCDSLIREAQIPPITLEILIPLLQGLTTINTTNALNTYVHAFLFVYSHEDEECEISFLRHPTIIY